MVGTPTLDGGPASRGTRLAPRGGAPRAGSWSRWRRWGRRPSGLRVTGRGRAMLATGAPPEQARGDAPSNPNLVRDRLANQRTFLAWLLTAILIQNIISAITLGAVVAGIGL